AYAFGHNMYCSFYQAVPLPELIRKTEQSLVFSQSRLNQWAVDLLEGGLRIFGMLSSESEEQLSELEDDASYLRQVDSHKNIQVCCIYKILQTFTYLLLGQYQTAYDIAEEVDPLIYTVGTQGLLPWPEHRFVRFLVISALFQDADTEKQAVWRKELEQSIEQFRLWNEHCPENQHHKFLFASAELLRIDGSYSQALFSYDRAIEMARHNGFTQWEGIASERASLLCRQMHNDNLTQVYWQQAYNCFRRFGATSKVRRMEMEYSDDIQSWLMNLHATQQATGNISSDVVEEFRKRHLHRVRSISNDVLKTRHSRDVAIQAGKQVKATERLRTEIAKRKREEKERVRLEEEIRHRHKMEAIGTLAGGIAHEFNNMLTIIIGNLELVAEEERDNEELMSCITDIQAASLRARNVVEKLQRFARKGVITKRPVEIRTVVKDALKLLSQTLPATVEMRSRLLCATETILADPTEIHQILINLCNNSVQAMSAEKGVLEVTLESLYLADGLRARDMELGPGAYIQLIVNDSGNGISDEIKDRIFDPYFTTKDVDEGLGMGLAVVLGIVKNHDGAIFVESQLGRGTRFKVLFPLIETVEEPATTSTERPTTASRQERILFVDDEEAITRMSQQIYERLGYQITTYNSPQPALEAFRDAPDTFDLVISDLTMPEMTGKEFALKLKAIRSSIPVIICTGHADVVNEVSAVEWGVESLLTKPLTKPEIERVVRDIFDEIGQ
ncbi:MAG TPA: response regulator, partial [Desulfopila sp.]|nr:response regulator [Desulfopila sp.]